MDRISGTVIRYRFHNDENSYSVADLKTRNGNVKIVGYFPKLTSDFEYEFIGEYVFDKKHGEQFKIESFSRVEIKNTEGLIAYLSSNLFTGIGEKTAQKIVDFLGQDAIKIILDDKNVLTDKGINLNPLRAERLYLELQSNQKSELTLIDLYSYGISPKMAMKIMNIYGSFTMEVIRENPYRLIDDIDGIGFKKADDIALLKIGLNTDDPRRLKAAILFYLNTMCSSEGNTYVLKDKLLTYTKRNLELNVDLSLQLELLVTEGKIIVEDDKYFLSTLYHIEVNLANSIKWIIENNERTNHDFSDLIEVVETTSGIKYTEKQKQAATTALNNNLSIITGGPGTGKTTIVALILELYRINNNINLSDEITKTKIALAAPTGRAAKRMKEVLGFEARTIHSLLGYSFDGEFKFNRDNKLPHDLLIIDEFSMVDVYLANTLLDSIKEGAQIVIVGDVDQLASVGPGQILYDLINSKKIETVRLNIIHRQAEDSKIIELAHKVNNQTLSYNELNSNDELNISNVNENNIPGFIKDLVLQAVDMGLDLYEDIQVLIPKYNGQTGIDRINSILQQEFVNTDASFMEFKERKYYVGDKVIQLVNDPNRQIMNGDIGVVVDIGFTNDNEEFLNVKFDSGNVTYYKGDLEELNLAYAISIHKSQGSEYPFVILPIVRDSIYMLKKELIYTAITRSKKYLTIVGDVGLLIYASNHLIEKRLTTLARRIRND